MRIRTLARLFVLGLAVVSAFGVARHSESVVRVTVVPLEGAPTVKDGLGGGDPDWRLDLRVGTKWFDLGTFQDQPFEEPLTWSLAHPEPLYQVRSVKLVEVDLAKNDVIEERPVAGLEFEGQSYRYTLETSFEWQAGIEWFLETPQGMLVALGIVVAMLLSFLKLELEG